MYLEKGSVDPVILAAYIVTLDDMLAEANNIMTDIAKHLATINCSASVFEDFPEVVVMHLTGKR